MRENDGFLELRPLALMVDKRRDIGGIGTPLNFDIRNSASCRDFGRCQHERGQE